MGESACVLVKHETRFELTFPSRSGTAHTRRSLIARTRGLAAALPSSVGNDIRISRIPMRAEHLQLHGHATLSVDARECALMRLSV